MTSLVLGGLVFCEIVSCGRISSPTEGKSMTHCPRVSGATALTLEPGADASRSGQRHLRPAGSSSQQCPGIATVSCKAWPGFATPRNISLLLLSRTKALLILPLQHQHPLGTHQKCRLSGPLSPHLHLIKTPKRFQPIQVGGGPLLMGTIGHE